MKISVIIPAYNEKENIKGTIGELLKVFDRIAGEEEFNIIVVDDHSSDTTRDIVKGVTDKRVNYLRLSKRSGSHVALRAGMLHAGSDAIIYVSADGQDNPEAIAGMVERWKNGAHVVWALRKTRKGESWYVRLPAVLFYKLILMFSESKETAVDLNYADFFLLDKKVVEAINKCPERNTSLFGLISWVGFKQDFVEYERRERTSGTSKWTLKSRIRLAKDWIVAFSGVPLKIITNFGMFFALIGFIFGIILIINVFLGKPLYGWSSLMVAILVMGGIQMMMLGIIGEYLWRGLDESRRRPIYFIEDKKGDV